MKKLIIFSLLFILILSVGSIYYQSYLATKRDNELKLEMLRKTQELLTFEEEPMSQAPVSKNSNKRFIVVPEDKLNEIILNQRRMNEVIDRRLK